MKARLLQGLWVCCLVLLIGCQPIIPVGQVVQVTRVISGQLLEVRPLDAPADRSERIRLIGIDVPDRSQQPWSDAARSELEALIGSDRTVVLETDVQPSVQTQNGDTLKLAYVWHGSTLLNETLVETGNALARGRSPNLKYEQRLAHAQEKARLLGSGIWNPDRPMRQTPEAARRNTPEG